MHITIYGLGYVGLVTGACLAEVGHHVLGVDINSERVAQLKCGIIPIYEPSLDSLVIKNLASGHLDFTTDILAGLEHAQVQFIAVGTPSQENGAANLNAVFRLADSIARHMCTSQLIINKSTVPVGTGDRVKVMMRDILEERGVNFSLRVASNPEFLKEGSAVNDFMKPDRIIVGTDCEEAEQILKEIYQPFNRNHDRVLVMNLRAAELTKYAANAMLATKISFMNEMANLAEMLGVDIDEVRLGIGSDPRIGYQFIYPGCGYGGSCFPKDVSALLHTAGEVGFSADLLQAVSMVNQKQKERLFTKIHQHFDGDIKGKTFAIWGLAFKPNTDDVREAPSLILMESLWEHGATIHAFDPKAMREVRQLYGERSNFVLTDNKEATLQQADALIICTEWSEFRAPDFALLKAQLKQPVIFDGRNLYDPFNLSAQGFVYYGMGRGDSLMPL